MTLEEYARRKKKDVELSPTNQFLLASFPGLGRDGDPGWPAAVSPYQPIQAQTSLSRRQN
jgi:hypothetical protein